MYNNLQYKDGGRIQDGVGLITSILLRYPEVGAVHYWREQHALKFTFMIEQHQEASSFQEVLKPALEFFHQLERQSMRVFDIASRSEETICVITVTRDVDSMTQREVGLIVELLKRKYKKKLIYDDIILPEDEQIFQEELISRMLSSIQTHDSDKNVVALREEGRVLVFKS
ncbi:MAG: hypothetical protein P4L49_02955 [Desulfosporosinus sp.]|nr:hypothetical protein [Desulfosporosinus sp.]